MANPLFNALGGGNNNGFSQMLNQFNQFKNSFKGDPKQTVMQMVNSGYISQAQLNQVQQAAGEFKRMLDSMKQ